MDSQSDAWNRYCDVRDLNSKSAESLKVDRYAVMKYHGTQSFDFSQLPDAVLVRAKRIICEGFSKTRGGNVPFYTNMICEFCPEPFNIGFICKKFMMIYIPHTMARDVLDSFRALAGIHDDLKHEAFSLRAAKFGQSMILYNGHANRWNASVLKEVKMLVKPTYDLLRPQREIALEFLEAGGRSERRFAYYQR